MPQKEEDFDSFVERLQQEIICKEVSDFNEHIVNLFHNHSMILQFYMRILMMLLSPT